MADCNHNIVPGRKEGTERCTKCSWRFPCPEATCAHADCLEAKGVPPKCYYCMKRVEGPMDDKWTRWSVRGHTRAVHYTCRSEHATPAERVRWGEL
jgi:hypothetical protein